MKKKKEIKVIGPDVKNGIKEIKIIKKEEEIERKVII